MTQFPIDVLRTAETPLYYYDLDLLRATLDAVKSAASDERYRVHYAIKANANPLVLGPIRDAGLGVDCVSGGEIEQAIVNGFNPADIVFAGVAKSDKEIEYALGCGIGCFNVESMPELENISALATARGIKARVALRVNPNIDAHTHHYITTGLAENKFGIDMRHLDRAIDMALALEGVELRGLHFHIGSQITDMTPFRILCERINDLQERLAERGVKVDWINVGGGLGIDYDDPDSHPIPDFAAYFDVFGRYLNLRRDQQLHFELGRAIVGQCGSLITRVLYVKEGVEKRFAMVDAGMTDLIRPALYQAHHLIQNITSPDGPVMTYDVVGPICESSDVFGTDESLPEVRRGDLLALRSAGAYGEIMASRYNLRRLPASMA